ncbi:pyridoxal phosphate-dependent decarboxylase family protein [Kibdelosporangium phytohabitans]|uniref:Pyridoxal-dependent decarboxylase n=1 Tax=Kibdelosporangium phytohabitans TaxID=860235 RepID=A0A0N7F4W5_9PSEU|nr:aminotransferase class V-fold PLP-dependent enzyme [Kibdelosporangium phytohabitans]ALG12567.1 pyridoxal-dependent decarboxylase [Kibdelosporangium phytohabitans]MBE1464189.1 glutamate/tyrosine decarboxylase-like PLP-dependent enzyme [Kibdelosporangium phytohabitans]
MDLRHWLSRAADFADDWAEQFGPMQPHASHHVSGEQFGAAFGEFTKRLSDNYPFFHPRYAGQMVKPPHPAAIIGYFTAMLFNPNNHAREGGPATTEMERECVTALADMVGFGPHVGHLTTSGTMANLEALYVARQLHPGKGIAFSSECHYTHERMCHVLGVQGHRLPVDAHGRVDLDALDHVLHTGQVGTVVVTAGTTGLGAVDPVHEAVALARKYGARIHVDAAYGGFYSVLARAEDTAGLDPRPWLAIADCDSVAVDPHKHGLQPYGCGAVLFADPRAGRHLSHDSPYTYFTDSALHLGEISLECSRAGAAAAALWLTLRLLPLTPDGFGRILATTRRAAVAFAGRIKASGELTLYQEPELDIVTYFPTGTHLSTVDARSDALLRAGMAAEDDPVYLSLLRTGADAFLRRHPLVARDADSARVLRSALIKPEAENYLGTLHARIEELAAEV